MAARAFKALARLPASDSPLLFPGERGGYFDIHHFRPYQWRPAQREVGIEPLRRIYDLRHTSRPSLSVPPSRLSNSPATWARAWPWSIATTVTWLVTATTTQSSSSPPRMGCEDGVDTGGRPVDVDYTTPSQDW